MADAERDLAATDAEQTEPEPARRSSELAEQDQPPQAAHAQPRTVLLVEDDPGIRDALREFLEQEGYPVEVAGNGREALEVLHRDLEQPGLILLDLMMPVMNGWEFLEAVRNQPAALGVPIVVLSAYREYDRKISSEALARRVAFLRKPVDIRLVMKLVEHYCGASAELTPGA
jgi:CheY-like chemotaxis protein